MKSQFVIYVPTDTKESTSVSFAKVAGVPLFLRSILSLHQAGVNSFTVIAPISHKRQLQKFWGKMVRDRRVHLNLLYTKDGSGIDASELRQLKEYTEGTIYLINANYVLPNLADTLTQAAKLKLGLNEVELLKPLSKRGAIVGFASQHIERLIDKAKNEPISMEECIAVIIDDNKHRYFDRADSGIIVEKFSEIRIAEEVLTEYIRVNTQTFVAREINKRISLPISLLLARMRVTPNTITIFNIFIGLCAGIGAAGLTYKGVLMGGILFQLASIIDGCDGEVAKLTFRTSKFGQYIDSLSDNLSLAAFITGMMIHQYRVTGSYTAFLWGAALLLGALSMILIMADFLRKKTQSASFVTFDKEFLQKLTPLNTPQIILTLIKYFKIFFKKDFFSLMFLITAILGILHWWFYFLAVGVWTGVAVLFYLREKHYK